MNKRLKSLFNILLHIILYYARIMIVEKDKYQTGGLNMYRLTVKIFRNYPSCEIVGVSFDSREKAYKHMHAWGNVLYDSMRRGEIDTYGLELEED